MKMFSKFFVMLLFVPCFLFVSQSCKGGKKVEKNELVLYVGAGCKYCKRVTDFMKKNSISFPTKDVWKSVAAKKELMALAGKGQVPCLKLNKKGDYMHESLDIIEKLKDIFNK